MDHRVDPLHDARVTSAAEPKHDLVVHGGCVDAQARLATGRPHDPVAALGQIRGEMRSDEAVDAGHQDRAHASVASTRLATRIALAMIVNVWFFEGKAVKLAASAT